MKAERGERCIDRDKKKSVCMREREREKRKSYLETYRKISLKIRYTKIHRELVF